MNFSREAEALLKKAGWYEDRELSLEELDLSYDDYPEFAVDFLKQYGNLKGECAKQDYTEVINIFYIFPAMDMEDLQGDNDYPYYQSILGKKLYPIGLYIPDGYYFCCDKDGRVYMLGEYCYYRGKNLYEGIENILLGWANTLQLDEDTGKWWNEDAEYVELPPLE